MRAFIYKWHRRLSIIIAIPVFLWAASGFMHPLMTNIKPTLTTQRLDPWPVDSSRIRMPLREALRQHHIDSIAGVRLVHIDTNWFYQVQPAWTAANAQGPASGVPVYLSCLNGNVLTAGDWLYAQYLAREFLEGQRKGPAVPGGMATNGRRGSAGESGQGIHGSGEGANGHDSSGMAGEHAMHDGKMAMDHGGMPAMNMTASGGGEHAESTAGAGSHDCCGAAADYVLNTVKGAPVANVSLLQDFDAEYKSINRLLPVYRVAFQRPDAIRVYVETTQDRFAFAMDNKRAIFDEIFRIFHTYGWLEWMGKGRLVVELSLALLALVTTLMGVAIFFVTTTKPGNGVPVRRTRRNHRIVSIVAATFTLMWTFSGAYHAFSKFTDDTRGKYFVRDNFATERIDVDWARLHEAVSGKEGVVPVMNLRIVRIDTALYYRVSTKAAEATYVGISDYRVLANGDARYAESLAERFSGWPGGKVDSGSFVTSFGDVYNFTDKRLPVWQVRFPAAGGERWFVETATGRLASKVNDREMREGWSFSVLHKHHFMDWGGKTARDASTMFWAFAQVLMVGVGLTLYIRTFKRR